MSFTFEELERIRKSFPALARHVNDQEVVYLDGPAGSQVPVTVAKTVADGLLNRSANRSGKFATSREVDELFAEAQAAVAAFVGANDPDEIVFGPNMTTLTFQFSRAIANTWNPGDEIVVTRLDHDANVTPWVLAARDRQVNVRFVEVDKSDCTLSEERFREAIGPKTRLVAFTCASNSVGSKTPVESFIKIAKQAGAITYLDAVHFAAHSLPQVAKWGCDFLACSAYKFYGPHIGIVWGRKDLLESYQPYKLRPSPNTVPARWMTGTQNHACIFGVAAAIEYLASIHETLYPDSDDLSPEASLRERLERSFGLIEAHEQALIWQLIDGIRSIPGCEIRGIVDRSRAQHRVPTMAFTAKGFTSAEFASLLGERGIFAWHGNYYALQLSETLGLEPAGMVRLGVMHYNTEAEISRTIDEVRRIMATR